MNCVEAADLFFCTSPKPLPDMSLLKAEGHYFNLIFTDSFQIQCACAKTMRNTLHHCPKVFCLCCRFGSSL